MTKKELEEFYKSCYLCTRGARYAPPVFCSRCTPTDYEVFVIKSAELLNLEKQNREEEAEILRDSMDSLWYDLSEEEKDLLSHNLIEEIERIVGSSRGDLC